MLVETVVRLRNLAHLQFSELKADLLQGAHFVFGLVLQNKIAAQEKRVGTHWRISLRIASG